MKVIFKIDRHLPEEKVISLRICRLHSHKPIDEYGSLRVDYSGFDLRDNETFIESLIKRCSNRIESQDEGEEILNENIPTNIKGQLDIDNLIGNVIQGQTRRNTSLLKMTRIDL